MHAARRALLSLRSARIPRTSLADVANLARRTGLFTYGLRLLKPVVYPDHRRAEPASVHERASYAALLAKCGLTEEALRLLSGTGSKTAEVALFSGFIEMNRWDYASAIPHFTYYLRKFKISDYERAVAELNLAAAFVFTEQADDAKRLLEGLLKVCAENEWKRLQANVLELSAQVAVQIGDWNLASTRLNEASALAKDDASTNLFIEKWRAILELKSKGPEPARVGDLKKVEQTAMSLGDWETIRDCHFHLASVLQDSELAAKVYFGTPYRTYRSNLEKQTSSWYSVPPEFIWNLTDHPADRTFDLQAGRELNGSSVRMKPGQGMHRLLMALASDMYRPHQSGALFSSVFPGEFFNPINSPQRVFQLSYRLREWFQAHQVPLDVDVRNGRYRLVAVGDYSLLFLRPKKNHSSESEFHTDALLRLLKQAWPYKAFSSAQATEQLAISPRVTKTLLRQWVQQGKVITSGRGRSTLYRFAK